MVHHSFRYTHLHGHNSHKRVVIVRRNITLYTDPARWVKLLLDQETARSFDRMSLEKASSNQFITINILMDILYELITSRRSLKSRRKALFNMYNKPKLMGKEGDKLDTFVSQLSRDMAACKMESFCWTDFIS